MERKDDSGIALIVTLLVLMLLAGLMAGFFAAVNADTRSNALDRDQTRAYAAAHAGLEKLTSDLAGLFNSDVSPSIAQINALVANPPSIPGFEFRAPGGSTGSGYAITWKADVNGNPAPDDPTGSNITAGPYKGFKGIVTKYPITITARSTSGGSEVRLRREVQTVAVPVFQFGVFSENDLTFYAGDDFNFGGRVHTNGNLFLCTFAGRTLQFSDRITAVGEIVRTNFSNGLSASGSGCTGTVNVPVTIGTPNTYRNLNYSPNEGSISGMPGTGSANTNWTSISTSTYKKNIINTMTGAKKLTLPIVSQGAVPRDLIVRSPVNDNVTSPNTYAQRYYANASLRILLSDRTTDITGLPGIDTSVAPVALDNWVGGAPAGYGPVDATHPPIARSPGAMVATTTLNGNPTGAAPSMVFVVNTPVPPSLELPVTGISVATNAGAQLVICTGKTATAFTGCNLGSNVLTNRLVQVDIPISATYTQHVQTQTTAATNSGASVTINVISTAGFSPSTFWVNGTAVAPAVAPTALVSCTGYVDSGATHQFTGCSYSGNAAPLSGQTISSNAVVPLDTAVLGGYLKIEKQNSAGVWSDVTLELLNLGFASPNSEGTVCADPNQNAVIRLQHLKDNGGLCDYTASQNPYDYWPNALYDAREGAYREVATTTGMTLGGVINYVTLDVGNLKKWLAGTTGTTGTQAWNNSGYIVYFSDRRGNHNAGAPTANAETGEYGFEDVINPASATGTPNGVLDAGEDVDFPANGLDTYGQTPAACCGVVPVGAAAPFDATARPWTPLTGNSGNAATMRVIKQVLFRRALKLINAGIVAGVSSLPTAGLTVVAENPVYVQGNWNATSTNASADPHVPSAIISDAVTLLSNNWRDWMSFRYPNSATTRAASTSGYRFAVVAGKGNSFPWPTAGAPQFLFGTDGGVGNFLRLLEDWNAPAATINYRGSIVSLYTSRQAVGTFRYGANVYDFGTRNFTFDTDFLLPSLLPPGTPMFRDINTLTFRQILRPTQ